MKLYKEKILTILGEISPGVDFEGEMALVDDELIDSLDMVSLVSALMDEFAIELSVDDLIPENFNSVGAIDRLVQSKKG